MKEEKSMRFMASLAALAVLALSPAPPLAQAAETSIIQKEEAGIPQAPSTPPRLRRDMSTEIIRCQRNFLWKGKTYDCDSFYRYDGDGLRPIVQDVPEAIQILDDYQRTRRNVRAVAYVATAGLAIAGLAFLASRILFAPGDMNAYGVRNIGVLAGGSISIASFVTGFILVKSNEARITRIVETYNQARPDTPIVLQFSTGFSL